MSKKIVSGKIFEKENEKQRGVNFSKILGTNY